MYQVKEKDWKQFRKMLPEWQEAYMERLTKEYRQPLKIQFLFLNIILNSKSEKTYRNITFYIIINIVFT